MNPFDYDTSSGIVSYDTSKIIDDVNNWWKRVSGSQTIPDPSSLEGRIIDAEVLARIHTASIIAFRLNQFNPNFVSGRYLDDLCALTGKKRRKAEKSTVQCQITGEIGTIIPKGSQISDQDGKVIWILSEELIITESPIVTTFESRDYGKFDAKVGTLTSILSQQLGWLSVTNISKAVEGALSQNDEQLRRERKNELALNSRSTTNAILSHISALKNVKSVKYYENATNKKIFLGNLPIEKKSTYLCVDGGIDSEIAEAYQIRSCGCGYSASPKNDNNFGIRTEVKWQDPYSKQIINVLFDRPRERKVVVNITVSGVTSNDIAIVIKKGIMEYSKEGSGRNNGFSLGHNLSTFEIASYINKKLPDIFISKLEIGIKNSATPMSCDMIENKIFEKCYIELEDDIKVKVLNV